jgi:hypothetical protein
VAIDGRQWLVYELHLTNFSREPLRALKLDVLGDSDASTVLSYGSEEMAARLVIASTSKAGAQAVEPGQHAIVYMEVPLSSARPPSGLRHRIEYASVGGNDVGHVIGGACTVEAPARLALGPPLRGGPWAAIYHWQWQRGHRRVFYTLDGRARLPGRFAIDWVRVDENGRDARGDPDIVKNAFGYGAEVIAVADARLAAVRDGVAESDRVSANPAHSLEEAAGNSVALDLGDGRFAIYEHLQPHSIRVARGERVKRGQVIAAAGFTGDSTGPHLHFHVADGAAPLLAEGVPFQFERFRVLGRYDDIATLGKSRWVDLESGLPEIRTRERPAPNVVVMF